MMEMKEQTGSRKKYLAPLVVLMLCLVALTGAAYAYTSSVISSQTAVEADYFAIDLYESDGDTPASAPVAETDVTVVNFQSAVDHGTGKIVVTATADDEKTIGIAYVVVKTDDSDITSCNLTITPVSPTLTGILSGMTVTASIQKVMVGSETITPAEGKYTVDTNETVAIYLAVEIGGTSTFNFDIGTGSGEYVNGAAATQACKAAFEEQALYSVNITAVSA